MSPRGHRRCLGRSPKEESKDRPTLPSKGRWIPRETGLLDPGAPHLPRGQGRAQSTYLLEKKGADLEEVQLNMIICKSHVHQESFNIEL